MFKYLIFISVIFSNLAHADCGGPPYAPIVKINIESCKTSKKYDNILEIDGKAHQVLSLRWSYGNLRDTYKVHQEDKKIPEKTFWLSAKHNKCNTILKSKKTLWLYSDICNDTNQNIPSIQLQELPKEIYMIAIKMYENAD